MSNYDPNEGGRRRRANRYADPNQTEPSMSAPSPMPGKPAASYVKPQPEQRVQPQAEWNPSPESTAGMGWNGSQSPVDQGYPAYPVQNYPQPSQGIPGGQIPYQQQYGGAWQQGYSPAPPVQESYPPVQQSGNSQPYQQPTGRGWSQPYPQQDQNSWQGGYNASQWNGGNGYAPVYDEIPQTNAMPESGMNGGGSGSGGGPSFDRAMLIRIAAAAAALVVVVTLAVILIGRSNQNKALVEYVRAYDTRYCEGVYVDGIHLGGMTQTEAKEAVQKSAQLKCDEWHVRLQTSAGEYVGEINSYDLGMTVHVDGALQEAWAQGRTGANEKERKAAMDALLKTPFYTTTALPGSNTAKIDSILNEIARNVYIPAKDAYIKTFTPNATNPFEIVEGTIGRVLDVEAIKEQVYDMVSRMETGVVLIEPQPLYPSVTMEDLKRQTTLIGSAYTPISSTSEKPRTDNIQRACDLITGTSIAPGETFSFNGVVGPRTKKNGFFEAIEYAYKKQQKGYGGGVCQVSSTIYIAAVRANMDIVKREQHGLEVGYTTLGLDATVNYDGKKIDFVFRNNTQGYIYIVTKVMLKPKIDRNHYLVICDIYGPAMEPGVTYDLVAIQTEVPIPEVTVVPDQKAEHVIYTDEMLTVEGKIGYEVDSFRVKYINGEEVERTHMYHDTYAPVQPITYVGVSERPIATMEPW